MNIRRRIARQEKPLAKPDVIRHPLMPFAELVAKARTGELGAGQYAVKLKHRPWCACYYGNACNCEPEIA